MKRKERLPELLAPAGDREALIAAVNAGADAVYIGGKSFGARAFAKNFDTEDMKFAVRYTHLHGVRLYVTVNTLVFDRELPELRDYIIFLSDIGVDAVICADLASVRLIRKYAPDLPIHASTQMSVHNTVGADKAYSIGCERVVLARELSFENIRSVTENCLAETEIFLHGALCVCHSGQCLMSSLVGGRSGNRGECAQPCRLPYNNGKYPLSLSDLSLAEHIESLINSGVASLKIEGRMKSAEYVYTVTKIYRTLLDEGRSGTKSELRRLERVFSRGGFTDGYFKGEKFSKMTGVRSDADKENSKEFENIKIEPERVRVYADASFRLGEKSRLTLTDGKRSVTVTGDIPTRAQTRPLIADEVKARLSKMGATLLSLDPGDIKLELEGGINLSPAGINALRRLAAEKFEDFGRARAEAPDKAADSLRKPPEEPAKPLKTALFLKPALFSDIMAKDPHACQFFDIVFLPIEAYDKRVRGVYIPPVIFDSEISDVRARLAKAKSLGAEYALVGNIGALSLASEAGLIPVGDFRLNITNSETRELYRDFGIEHAILSPELTLPMARDIGGGVITYGRIPLMLTERCFMKENFGCEKCSSVSLTDRTGAKFPMIYEYGHRNLILNSRPTYMGDKKDELRSTNIKHGHFIFSVEDTEEALGVISAYKCGEPLPVPVRRIGKR